VTYEEEVERGARFKVLTSSETWNDLEAVMIGIVAESEDLLLAYKATDVDIIKALHRKAINTRDFYNLLKQNINGFINAFDQYQESKAQATEELQDV
jgi:hypothetical protein